MVFRQVQSDHNRLWKPRSISNAELDVCINSGSSYAAVLNDFLESLRHLQIIIIIIISIITYTMYTLLKYAERTLVVGGERESGTCQDRADSSDRFVIALNKLINACVLLQLHI